MNFFFNDTAPTEIYTLSLHDALPISTIECTLTGPAGTQQGECEPGVVTAFTDLVPGDYTRSEEHTSELQSLAYLVCRLLLEKKNNDDTHIRAKVGHVADLYLAHHRHY